jgi:glycosyltransferase involved in cell wall biosynthesis
MNILILTDKYPPDVGGLAVSSRRLARGLAQAGHTVWVSTLTSSVAPGAAIASDEDGLTVLRVGAHRRADDTLADWFGQVVAFHSALEWDLIHAMYITRPAFVAVTAARYLQRPSVISARGNDLDRTAFDPAKFSQVLWSLQHADAITAVTTDLARKARALVPGREVRCIPNGVDTQLFAPGLRDEALAESLDLGDAPVVAFVGEARRKKGFTVLLPAFAHLGIQGERPPVLLLIGGVRRDDMPVLEVFRRQNPSLDIRIVPNVAHEQLPAYYHLADLLVFPSLRDGMPNALLEGMACGKAVVASKVGGMPEVLRGDDPENGLLVPPGDPIALAEAMGALLADRSRRERMGRAARATVEAEFTPERETSRNLEIYRAVMGSS